MRAHRRVYMNIHITHTHKRVRARTHQRARAYPKAIDAYAPQRHIGIAIGIDMHIRPPIHPYITPLAITITIYVHIDILCRHNHTYACARTYQRTYTCTCK
eukprot:GEMP01117192.1.p1 GENE.GEMP01117192.1~~GEMP01117192.1.p1  ORF type:complete len:101 (-),score=1.97 GEMP01117192.1:47-349(-)